MDFVITTLHIEVKADHLQVTSSSFFCDGDDSSPSYIDVFFTYVHVAYSMSIE
jgi:hypothetical protein